MGHEARDEHGQNAHFLLFLTVVMTLCRQATALAAELEALLAQERLESTGERPVAAELESKPEKQPKASEPCQPDQAKQIVEPAESAEAGDVAEPPLDADASA